MILYQVQYRVAWSGWIQTPCQSVYWSHSDLRHEYERLRAKESTLAVRIRLFADRERNTK